MRRILRSSTKRRLTILGIATAAVVAVAGAAVAHAATSDAGSRVSGSGPNGIVAALPSLRGVTPMHGETVAKDTSTGATVLEDIQTGKVTAISSSSMTVRSDDGTTWTWSLSDVTRARKDPFTDRSVSSVKVGNTVAVSGTRSGDTRTAHLLFDPPLNLGKLRGGLPKRLPDLKPGVKPDVKPDVKSGLPALTS